MDDLEGPGRLLYASGAEVDDLMTFFVERSKAGEESQVGAMNNALLPSTQAVFLFLKKIYQGIPAKPTNKKTGSSTYSWKKGRISDDGFAINIKTCKVDDAPFFRIHVRK